MSERRYIRLKETTPGMDVVRELPAGYVESTDGGVGAGPFRVRTDEHGFIMTGNDAPDGPPLVFLGDSFVEATFTPEQTRFVSQVERNLAAAGMPFRCLNGGYSGTTTLQLFNVFLNKIVPIVGRGGAVVFFIPQSDLPIYFRPESYWYPTDRYAPVLPPFNPTASDIPKGGDGLASLLRLTIMAADQFGIRLLLVSSPHRHTEPGNDPYLDARLPLEQRQSLSTRRAEIRRSISEVTGESSATFFDADADLMPHPEFFYDELHLNDEGHHAFSDWLSARLQEALSGTPTSTEERPDGRAYQSSDHAK